MLFRVDGQYYLTWCSLIYSHSQWDILLPYLPALPQSLSVHLPTLKGLSKLACTAQPGQRPKVTEDMPLPPTALPATQ